MLYNSLQLCEVFHLEFLRRLGRTLKSDRYALKGGANLRFFFNSFRYSEDMDLDLKEMNVVSLSDTVMKILLSPSFKDFLKPFGIESIIAPDISKAKQTQTTQRCKIHIITEAGEDLYTKVEFSRRGFSGNAVVQLVPTTVLRNYGLAPFLASHYDANSSVIQKVKALAGRRVTQARDIFDLYLLSSQKINVEFGKDIIKKEVFKKAYENVFNISYEQFRDTVISYLSIEDQESYKSEEVFNAIRFKTADFIKEMTSGKG
jgi:predicted nucleotidyltransferase component of viral defense system